MKYIRFAAMTLLLGKTGIGVTAERNCPETIRNSYECSQYLERELAKDFPRLFSREGPRLTVALANGRKKTYVDIPDEKNHGVGGAWFNIVRHYAQIDYALVAVQYYEGGTHYFLNLTTGAENDIVGTPSISPDGRRIAVANVDLEAGYTPNVLAVFKLQPDGLVEEYRVTPEDWGADDLYWVNSGEIAFVEYRLKGQHDPKHPDEYIKRTPRKLKYQGMDKQKASAWAIE